MNLRKAAEMALEIIEGEWPADDEIASPVMYALREALAQPEQEPVAWMMFGVDKPTRVILHKPSDEHKKVFSCIFPLYTHEEALAKPEQNPVAYRTVNNVGAYVYHSADRLPNEYGLRGEALYLHPAPIPEGWQLVPKEPTEAMLYAGDAEIDPGYCEESSSSRFVEDRESIAVYKAMLAAAPKPEELK